MTTDKDRTTRERAYHLWVESGHQHGNDEEHWHQAEREAGATPSAGPVQEPPVARPAAKAKKASGEASASVAVPDAAAPKASSKPRGRTMAPSPKA